MVEESRKHSCRWILSLIIRYNWNASFLTTSFQVKLSGRAPPSVIFLPRSKYFIFFQDRFSLFFFARPLPSPSFTRPVVYHLLSFASNSTRRAAAPFLRPLTQLQKKLLEFETNLFFRRDEKMKIVNGSDRGGVYPKPFVTITPFDTEVYPFF